MKEVIPTIRQQQKLLVFICEHLAGLYFHPQSLFCLEENFLRHEDQELSRSRFTFTPNLCTNLFIFTVLFLFLSTSPPASSLCCTISSSKVFSNNMSEVDNKQMHHENDRDLNITQDYIICNITGKDDLHLVLKLVILVWVDYAMSIPLFSKPDPEPPQKYCHLYHLYTSQN